MTLPIIQAFGFKPYTAGTLLLDPRCLVRTGGDRAGALGPEEIARFDQPMQDVLREHIGYGCSGLFLDGAGGPMAALYRIKWFKRAVPAAQFVFGDPHRLARSAGPLMRKLITRGISFAMMDAPLDVPGGFGVTHMPSREIRYAKGGTTPAAGDLLGTEIAIFGP
jgi:hypothetical protein